MEKIINGNEKNGKSGLLRILIWAAALICDIGIIIYFCINGVSLPLYLIPVLCAVALSWSAFDKRFPMSFYGWCVMAGVVINILVCGLLGMDVTILEIIALSCCVFLSVFREELLILAYGGICLGEIIGISIMGNNPAKQTIFYCIAIILVTLYVFATIKFHKNTEQKLTDTAQTALAAEKAKSDFVSNMSHEIRTPMNSIIGMCELILREKDLSPKVRRYGFNIQSSGRSLMSIINDILDFSRIESGKMELHEDEFNLASTLNDVINMTTIRMEDKKLELVVRVDPDIPKILVGDETRIRQVMINLMTNAIKYTVSGAVTLRVTQSRHEYGINLVVSVKDTGIGITAENLEKLFISFQQVDTRKDRKVEGTGLGLAISKRLITSMGGFINVSSTYGKGSEFKFVIPLKVKDRQPFIMIQNSDYIYAASYVDLSKFNDERIAGEYEQLVSEIGEQLHVMFTAYRSFDRLEARIRRGGITHCFTGRREFLEHQAFFEELSDNMEVIVIQDRAEAVRLPNGIKCIYKPFYALSIVGALNNEGIIQTAGHANANSASFTAPKARVLVVDDSFVNLQVTEGLLRPYKVQIFAAGGGKEAIHMVESATDMDLIFMDHMMPEIDGIEALKIIRKMGATEEEMDYYKNVPIIALTANAAGDARNMFLGCGFSDFLPKPIELATLDRIMKKWLPRHLQQKLTSEEINKEGSPEMVSFSTTGKAKK